MRFIQLFSILILSFLFVQKTAAQTAKDPYKKHWKKLDKELYYGYPKTGARYADSIAEIIEKETHNWGQPKIDNDDISYDPTNLSANESRHIWP